MKTIQLKKTLVLKFGVVFLKDTDYSAEILEDGRFRIHNGIISTTIKSTKLK